MPEILIIIALIVLSAGILLPRNMTKKLNAGELLSLENVRNESRKYYFISLIPLVLMALLIYKNQGTTNLIMYQIPAGSLVVDLFCIMNVRRIINSQKHEGVLRFTLIPFISLSLTKILLFAAFLIEAKEQQIRQAFVFNMH